MNDIREKLLRDPEVKKAYEDMKPEFDVATALIEARTRAHLTQAEVAKRMGTSQSAVARLESGHYLPSLKSLQKYACAVNRKIPIEIYPSMGF